jgi:type I restriction enzyme S subunit
MAGNGWTLKSIEELKASANGAIAIGPFGSRMKSDCYVPSGVQVIRGTNISDTRTLIGEMVCITPKLADQLGNAIVHADDLVFPHRGSIGLVGIVPRNNVERYALSSSLMKLTCDRKQVEPLFLFYFFRSDEGRHELLKNASTVGTPGIGQPLSSLRSIKVPLPPLAEQKAIAAVLGALDDKIELNRRMNATLEAMARALFQSWFIDFDPVRRNMDRNQPSTRPSGHPSPSGRRAGDEGASGLDFDPVRAKLDGRQPVGLDTATAALFPAHFDHQSDGVVPTGWLATTLGDVIEISDSKRIPLSGREREARKGKYPYHGAASVMDYVDDYLFDGIYALMGEDGSVINEDGTPVLQYVWGKFWVNNHAHVLRGKNGISTEHLLLHLKGCNIAAFVNGAVQPKLNQGNMNRIPFILPPPEIGQAFAKTIEPLFAQIRANTEQSRTLATLRDTLLPKLLSGELSVAETNRQPT